MSAIPPSQRIELSPCVRAILETDGTQSEFLRRYVRYLQALLDPDTGGLDDVGTTDVRCHELEAMGIPPGREGLKMFRRQINAAIPDEHISVTAVRFEGDDIIEADMVMNATHTGQLFDIPATGRKIRFDVHERCRDGPKSISKTSGASSQAPFNSQQWRPVWGSADSRQAAP